MKTKDRILEILKVNTDKYISGEEMAERLFLTRAAVWKSVKRLKEEGYEIDAVTNKGYRLIVKANGPSLERIEGYLKEYTHMPDCSLLEGLDIVTYEETTSTNDVARSYALNNPQKSALIIAASQTKGRGRRGRKFYSPEGSGLYLSFVIYPDMELNRATKFTSMTAVALARAIEDVCGISVSIKWVNDIFYNDKKVAGILTEGYSSLEDSEEYCIIIGVGINLYTPKGGFPDDIKDIAGALLKNADEEDIFNRLTAALIYRMSEVITEPASDYLGEYRERSMLIGHYVKMVSYQGNNKRNNEYALVTGIDDDCRLIIRYDDGKEAYMSSGEVGAVRY